MCKVAVVVMRLTFMDFRKDILTILALFFSFLTDEPQRQRQAFAPSQLLNTAMAKPKQSVRDYFGKDEAVYIMDAKHTGNIGRYLNVSIVQFYCSISLNFYV